MTSNYRLLFFFAPAFFFQLPRISPKKDPPKNPPSFPLRFSAAKHQGTPLKGHQLHALQSCEPRRGVKAEGASAIVLPVTPQFGNICNAVYVCILIHVCICYICYASKIHWLFARTDFSHRRIAPPAMPRVIEVEASRPYNVKLLLMEEIRLE